MVRRKHPDKDIESLIKRAEAKKWTVTYNPKTSYWRARCDCGKHQKIIHKTPALRQYTLNLRKWFERQPCWKAPTTKEQP